MNTFLDFLSDNTFFAIFSGIIVVLVLAFIVTLIKGKQEDKKPIEDVPEENYMMPSENLATPEIASPEIASDYNYGASIEAQMMGSNSADTGYQAAITNYVPDLNEEPVSEQIDSNISNVNYETPVMSEPIIPEAKEIDINIPNIIEEEPSLQFSSNDESLTPEITDSLIPDFSTKEEVDVEPIIETSEPEEVEMPMRVSEAPELAFASIPTGDSFINEDIKIETSEEYDYEKTEIFDFPDFSKTEL
ncbi:MAG: hypothetical protein K2L98_02540, partial [Bacilli bacterium]|nr:hypothetical protein [Bacilli bacterium]